MKKSTLYGTSAALLLAAGIVATPLVAHAAPTTTANATFAAGTGTTSPQDPTKPNGGPVTPPVLNPGPAGALRIDYAPASLQFETKALFGTTTANPIAAGMTLYANPVTLTAPINGTNVPNFVQVTDQRGTFAGWNVTVSGTAFTTSATGIPTAAQTLTGAALTISNGTVNIPSSLGGTATGYTANATIAVSSDGTTQAPVMSATAGNGAGTYQNAFGTLATEAFTSAGATATPSIALSIPSTQNVAAASYTATLTWTLNSVPA
jgi:hypothetical protein